jgi:hypothetical protein
MRLADSAKPEVEQRADAKNEVCRERMARWEEIEIGPASMVMSECWEELKRLAECQNRCGKVGTQISEAGLVLVLVPYTYLESFPANITAVTVASVMA